MYFLEGVEDGLPESAYFLKFSLDDGILHEELIDSKRYSKIILISTAKEYKVYEMKNE